MKVLSQRQLGSAVSLTWLHHRNFGSLMRACSVSFLWKRSYTSGSRQSLSWAVTHTHTRSFQMSQWVAWSPVICCCVLTQVPVLNWPSLFFALLQYLYVQSGEVAVKVLRVIDVRLCADRTHHVSDVLVSHRYGEMLLETSAAHRALAGCQRLHLKNTPKK